MRLDCRHEFVGAAGHQLDGDGVQGIGQFGPAFPQVIGNASPNARRFAAAGSASRASAAKSSSPRGAGRSPRSFAPCGLQSLRALQVQLFRKSLQDNAIDGARQFQELVVFDVLAQQLALGHFIALGEPTDLMQEFSRCLNRKIDRVGGQNAIRVGFLEGYLTVGVVVGRFNRFARAGGARQSRPEVAAVFFIVRLVDFRRTTGGGTVVNGGEKAAPILPANSSLRFGPVKDQASEPAGMALHHDRDDLDVVRQRVEQCIQFADFEPLVVPQGDAGVVRIAAFATRAAVGGNVKKKTIASDDLLLGFGEPVANRSGGSGAANSGNLMRTITQAQVPLRAKELGHQPVGFGQGLGVLDLQRRLLRQPIREVDVDRGLGGVSLLNQTLKKQDVLLQRRLIAGGRVAAGDHQKMIGA